MSDLDLPDVNLLVALLHPDHVHHRAAQEWFASVTRVASTPVTESGLVRMALNPAVMGGPTSAETAMASLRSLRGHERAVFLPDDSTLAASRIDLIGPRRTRRAWSRSTRRSAPRSRRTTRTCCSA